MVTIPWRAGFHPGPCPVAAASHQTACTAAAPKGASELAQRLECARWLALLQNGTPPGALPMITIPDRIRCSPTDVHPWMARSHLGSGRGNPSCLPGMREGVGVCGHGMESPLGLWWEGEGLGSPYNGGKRQQSTRCRGSERRLRTREAHGVRQLAGAFRATALRPETHPTRAFHERPNWLLTRRHCSLEGRVPPRPKSHSGSKPQHWSLAIPGPRKWLRAGRG